jgi:SAM-dependent methyltransferase
MLERLGPLRRKLASNANCLKRTWLYPYAAVNSGLRRAVREFSAGVRGGVLLDVGCGKRPYQEFFPVENYIGIDVPVSGRPTSSKNPDLWFDGRRFPLESASVDHVLCTQVLQHVLDPHLFFAELQRVMRPNGHLILSAPQTEPSMEIPFDRYRFTIDAIRDLCRDHQFKIVSERPAIGFWQTIAFELNTFLVLTLLPKNRSVAVLVCSTSALLTQALAWGLDHLTKYDRHVNAWVVHAFREC